MKIWTVSSHSVQSSCLSTLVHRALVGTLLRCTLRVSEALSLYPLLNLYLISKVTRESWKEHDLDNFLEVREKSAPSTLVVEPVYETRVSPDKKQCIFEHAMANMNNMNRIPVWDDSAEKWTEFENEVLCLRKASNQVNVLSWLPACLKHCLVLTRK